MDLKFTRISADKDWAIKLLNGVSNRREKTMAINVLLRLACCKKTLLRMLLPRNGVGNLSSQPLMCLLSQHEDSHPKILQELSCAKLDLRNMKNLQLSKIDFIKTTIYIQQVTQILLQTRVIYQPKEENPIVSRSEERRVGKECGCR